MPRKTKNRFVHVNKKLMINVYEPNLITPDKSVDTDVFYDLLKCVIPHELSEDIFRLDSISISKPWGKN